jgi:hypothetical protein
MKFQSKLSNGSWHDETKPERIKMFIDKAVKAETWIARNERREPRSANEIKAALAAGEVVKYDGDWYAEIRDADAQAPKFPHGIASTYERTLDCGHTVYNKSEVMTTSSGTSCHRCYARMSD